MGSPRPLSVSPHQERGSYPAQASYAVILDYASGNGPRLGAYDHRHMVCGKKGMPTRVWAAKGFDSRKGEYPLACGVVRMTILKMNPVQGVFQPCGATRPMLACTQWREEYPLACGMPLPEPLERQGLASPGSRERLRFHHAYGYASLTVGSFKPHTTIMQWWPLDRRFTESVRRPEGGRHWVLHACCPYPHTKSAVRILHKPLMQPTMIMRPATVHRQDVAPTPWRPHGVQRSLGRAHACWRRYVPFCMPIGG